MSAVLIKATNHCDMGCSHCMEGSTVAGEHMTKETFLSALELTGRLEGRAWEAGIPRIVLLSGGEATEHPDIVWFIETALRQAFNVVLITNGMWLDKPELAAQILESSWDGLSNKLTIQISNDPRFYPRRPTAAIPADPRIVFVPALTALIPLGRLKIERATSGPPIRKAPTSFNLRSMTRTLGDVREALIIHRARALAGKGGHCSPSISHDGTLAAGETNSCFPIGDVNSTPEQVTKALIEMTCNRCGLVDALSPENKRAIGEAL